MSIPASCIGDSGSIPGNGAEFVLGRTRLSTLACNVVEDPNGLHSLLVAGSSSRYAHPHAILVRVPRSRGRWRRVWAPIRGRIGLHFQPPFSTIVVQGPQERSDPYFSIIVYITNEFGIHA